MAVTTVSKSIILEGWVTKILLRMATENRGWKGG